MMMGLLREAIEAYAGLSPMEFFTILALMAGVYRLVCGMFVDPPLIQDLKKPPPLDNSISQQQIIEQVLVGEISEEQLKSYDGSHPNKPLLMAIKGQIYDVSTSRMFYGPGGPYALFSGREASRALALMSFNPNDLTGNIEGLGSSELDTLQEWEYKLKEKYPKVGQIATGKTDSVRE